MACGILVPQPGIEPTSLASEAQHLNHWTAREVRKINHFKVYNSVALTSLVAQTVKHLSAMRETQVRSLGREGPWRRKWQSTPVLLPGKSHGQRSLVDYSPWSRKESDMTERSSSSLHV